MNDLISREDVKRLTTKRNNIWNEVTDAEGRGLDEILDSIPSAVQYTDDEIQRMQDIEQEQIEKAYDIGYAEGKADAVPVVRCKDCKQCRKTILFGHFATVCDYWIKLTDDDGYCNHAERKEE